MGVCCCGKKVDQKLKQKIQKIQQIKRNFEYKKIRQLIKPYSGPSIYSIFSSQKSVGSEPTISKKKKQAYHPIDPQLHNSQPDLPKKLKERIIKNDQRQLVKNIHEYPFSAIGHLKFQSDQQKSQGTAFLISPTLAMTCSHNCYNQETHQEFYNMIFHPGYKGQEGSDIQGYKVKKFYYPQQYQSQGELQYEYAILEFEEEIGKKYGYLGLDFTQQYTGQVHICGYPGQVRGNKENKDMYKDNGSFQKNEKKNNLLKHYVSTTAGQSGSPIFFYSNQGVYSLGIHTNESEKEISNQGIFLNETIRRRINQWKNQSNLILHLKQKNIKKNHLTYMKNSDLGEVGILNLDNNNLGDEEMIELSQVYLPHLKQLHLSNDNITNQGLKAFINNNMQQLLVLDLSSNKINQEGIMTLSKIGLKNLRKLNLQNNGLKQTAIFQLICCHFPQLTELNLSHNQFKDVGLRNLADGKWPFLTSLNLSSNQIDYKGIKHLINGNWPLLEVLNLQQNKLEQQGVQELVENTLWSHLKQLNLSNNKIGDNEVRLIGASKWRQLSILKLNGNRITDDGIFLLTEAFKNTLKHQLQVLELNNNKLVNYFGRYLSEISWPSLEILQLSSNKIQDKGAALLAEGKWENLKRLSIGDNQLGSTGVNALLKKEWRVLSHLQLDLNCPNKKEEYEWKTKIKNSSYYNNQLKKIKISFK